LDLCPLALAANSGYRVRQIHSAHCLRLEQYSTTPPKIDIKKRLRETLAEIKETSSGGLLSDDRNDNSNVILGISAESDWHPGRALTKTPIFSPPNAVFKTGKNWVFLLRRKEDIYPVVPVLARFV